jgi:hypothetical protein
MFHNSLPTSVLAKEAEQPAIAISGDKTYKSEKRGSADRVIDDIG